MRATGKNERIAQILETGVTREQLAGVVWSMERDYAGHVELIKELMDERAALRSENAKLRKAMDFQALELGCMTDNRDVLHVENAKLRKLCADMYRDFVNCDCELRLHGRTFMAETRYAQRMRKLGIEVK